MVKFDSFTTCDKVCSFCNNPAAYLLINEDNKTYFEDNSQVKAMFCGVCAGELKRSLNNDIYIDNRKD